MADGWYPCHVMPNRAPAVLRNCNIGTKLRIAALVIVIEDSGLINENNLLCTR